MNPVSLKKPYLLGATILATLAVYGLTVYLCAQDSFAYHIRWTNGWAIGLSLASLASLYGVYWFVERWVPPGTAAPDTPTFVPPRTVWLFGLCLAGLWVAVCLPATFRAVSHPREVMVFWHDEAITLEFAQAFIENEYPIPRFRFGQGWITFLPVVLPLKALHQLVPVPIVLTNVVFRLYQLAAMFCIVYTTYRLIWQISGSIALSAVVVLIAYGRAFFFNIALAIDRPDPMQLLFVVLSLTYIHRFWIAGRPSMWFCAATFAALGFASKYSGHLLAPVLMLAWIAHWRRPEVRQAFTSPVKYWLRSASLYLLSLSLIFPFAFFLFSPYHLIRLDEVIDFFTTFLRIYQSGDVYNRPDFQAPSRLSLWWGIFTSDYLFDWWLTVLGLIGGLLTVAKNTIFRKPGACAAGDWILLSWGGCYISFLLYQYGLADYRYIMPAQFVLPFFFLKPILWLEEIPAVARQRGAYIAVLGCLAAVVCCCQPRLEDAREFLAKFRAEESAPQCFEVGRYLDRTVAFDKDPEILITNLAYIPPRFTKLHIRNVDVTCALIAERRYDYILITNNMCSTYADKPTAGQEKRYDPLYKVRYVDVVEAYTRLKNRRHPDYEYVKSFAIGDLFQRVTPAENPFRLTSATK